VGRHRVVRPGPDGRERRLARTSKAPPRRQADPHPTSDCAAAKVGPVEATHTRDVSKGGLGFPVAYEIEVGTILSIELDREFGGPPLSALARVARCVREADGWFAGVEFTWIECALPETALGLSPQNAWTFM